MAAPLDVFSSGIGSSAVRSRGSGGAYWGIGNPLFHVTTACGTFSEFIRAYHRDHAIEKLERDYEGIKFYRGASK